MNEIWVKRLIAGTQKWADAPQSRKPAILALLRKRVEDNEITAERFEEITGEVYEA